MNDQYYEDIIEDEYEKEINDQDFNPSSTIVFNQTMMI